MMKKLIVTLLFLLQLPTFAAYVAVLETMSEKDLLTIQERQYLTDVLRSQAIRTLPAEQNYTIMTRENINVMLPPGKSIEDCEGSCLAETGKNIAADYVAQARIGRVGENMFISAELYETSGSKLVASFQGRGERVDDLERVIIEKAPSFFKKARSGSNFGTSISELSYGGSFDLNGVTSYVVSISSDPEEAVLSMDGRPLTKCLKTPCLVQIEAGEHRFVVVKEHYEDADSIIKIDRNNQNVVLQMKSITGTLNLKPMLPDSNEDFSKIKAFVDNDSVKVGEVILDPGIHDILLTHPCYDPVTFKVGIETGKEEVYEGTLNRGVAGLSLAAVRNGNPASETVYVNGDSVGVTPYLGKVPMCSKITIGRSKQIVPVSLVWHETVEFVFEIPYDKSLESQVAWSPDAAPKDSSQEMPSFVSKRHVGFHLAGTYNDWWGEGAKSDGLWGLGFVAGVSAVIPIAKIFAVHPEIDFDFRRMAGVIDYEGFDLDVSTKMINVSVPLMARAQLMRDFYLELGPMLSTNLNATETVEYLGNEISESLSEYFSSFEADVVFSLGTTLYPKGKVMDVDFRFVLGLTNVSKDDEGSVPECKNLQFSLGVTYWFL